MRASLIRGLLRGDERFAVTGASGWLGRTTLDLLARTLGEEEFTTRVTGFATTAKSINLRDGSVVPLRPLSELGDLDPAPTHIVHLACVTRDRVATMGVAPYVVANLGITATVLQAVERFRPRGIAVASSGAVYEGDGRLANDLVGNPYGSLKHLEELVLRRAAADAGGRSVVARIFSVGGAYITKPALYALGDLILQALAGEPLVVRAQGPVIRSYSSAADIVALFLTCLLAEFDRGDIVFDSGGTIVEVGELAERVRVSLGMLNLPIRRSLVAEALPDHYVGDGHQMKELAAQHGLRLRSLDEQILDTAAYLQGPL